jgi:hypothetical protein
MEVGLRKMYWEILHQLSAEPHAMAHILAADLARCSTGLYRRFALGALASEPCDIAFDSPV